MLELVVTLALLTSGGLTTNGEGRHLGWRNKKPRTVPVFEQAPAVTNGGAYAPTGGTSDSPTGLRFAD